MTINIKQIRAARGFLNWTQADLAKKAGLSQATVCRMEDPRYTARPDTIETCRVILEKEGIQFAFGGFITGDKDD
jgi:predicted transcriptional regulator